MTTGDLDIVAEEDDGMGGGGGPASLSASTGAKPKRTGLGGREKSYGDLTRKSTENMRRAPSVKAASPISPASTLVPASNRSREPSPGHPKIVEEDEPPLPPPSEDKPGHIAGASPTVETPRPREMSETTAFDHKAPSIPSTPGAITVFLQVGRNVKKAPVDVHNLSFASLRVLFVDLFSYNPGSTNFPNIYIRDPSSGVQYELDNLDEIHDKCLLSLNIERESLHRSGLIHEGH